MYKRQLFAFAKEELNRLYETGEPFNLTMATMDIHCVEGYTCELCEDEYENPYYNVISCSDRQLSAFVDLSLIHIWGCGKPAGGTGADVYYDSESLCQHGIW